ncbi:hypothetical protein D3C76_524080 [compost metagenome]
MFKSALCEKHPGTAILQQVFDTLFRQRRIDWKVRTSSLKNGQQNNRHLRGAFNHYSNDLIRLHSKMLQSASRLIRPCVQFTVCQLLFAVGYSDPIRALSHLCFEHPYYRAVREIGCRIVEQIDNLTFFFFCNHHNVCKSYFFMLHDRIQYFDPMTR